MVKKCDLLAWQKGSEGGAPNSLCHNRSLILKKTHPGLGPGLPIQWPPGSLPSLDSIEPNAGNSPFFNDERQLGWGTGSLKDVWGQPVWGPRKLDLLVQSS